MDPESSERQIVLFPSPAWRDKTGETRAFEHFLTTDDSMRSLSLHFSVDHILRPPLHDASNPILLLHYSDSSPRINANRPPWEMSAGGNNSVLKWWERERKREKKWIKRDAFYFFVAEVKLRRKYYFGKMLFPNMRNWPTEISIVNETSLKGRFCKCSLQFEKLFYLVFTSSDFRFEDKVYVENGKVYLVSAL